MIDQACLSQLTAPVGSLVLLIPLDLTLPASLKSTAPSSSGDSIILMSSYIANFMIDLPSPDSLNHQLQWVSID
jgi:hypothetical protein